MVPCDHRGSSVSPIHALAGLKPWVPSRPGAWGYVCVCVCVSVVLPQSGKRVVNRCLNLSAFYLGYLVVVTSCHIWLLWAKNRNVKKCVWTAQAWTDCMSDLPENSAVLDSPIIFFRFLSRGRFFSILWAPRPPKCQKAVPGGGGIDPCSDTDSKPGPTWGHRCPK